MTDFVEYEKLYLLNEEKIIKTLKDMGKEVVKEKYLRPRHKTLRALVST